MAGQAHNLLTMDAVCHVMPWHRNGDALNGWKYVGHGIDDPVGNDIPNVEPAAWWFNNCKGDNHPLPFQSYPIAMYNNLMEPYSKGDVLRYRLQDAKQCDRGPGKKGDAATKLDAEFFYLATRALQVPMFDILTTLSDAFMGSASHLRSAHTCYLRLHKSLGTAHARDFDDVDVEAPRSRAQKRQMIDDGMKSKTRDFIRRHIPEDMDPAEILRRAKRNRRGLPVFSIMSRTYRVPKSADMPQIKRDMRSYVKSLVETFPEEAAKRGPVTYCNGWPSFLTPFLVTEAEDLGHEHDDELLIGLCGHFASQTHLCDRKNFLEKSFDFLNFQCCYAFCLRLWFFDAWKDPLTGMRLTIFKARTMQMGGFGHIWHTRPIQFGYTRTNPSLAEHFDERFLNVMFRSRETRAANAVLFPLDRAKYNKALADILRLGLTRTDPAHEERYSGWSDDHLDLLRHVTERALASGNHLRGVISDVMALKESGRFKQL